ncbi:MAG: WhiB family transcriptional regulator [Actinomycetota bacterium]|nr:WhiB family transcriptional regulator [Actinomycetota bacterium]
MASTDVRASGDWRSRGACREDPDRLFVQGAAQRAATRTCRPCPVRTRCLAEALDRRIEFGVWGGLTERERRALLRRHPDVRNWTELLELASPETVSQSRRPAGDPLRAAPAGRARSAPSPGQ